MKVLRVLYIALVALVAGAFSSCTEEYKPGDVPAGPQIAFMTSNPTSFEFDQNADGQEVKKIVLSRVNTKKRDDVWVYIQTDPANKELFKADNIVTFLPGETTAELAITVDYKNFEDDKVYSVKFSIADEYQKTPYGFSEWTVDFALNPWKLMNGKDGKPATGKARVLAAIDFRLGVAVPAEIETNIYKHKDKDWYKVESPWIKSFVYLFENATTEDVINSFETTTPAPGLVFNCEDPNNVIIPEQKFGLKDIYGVWSGDPTQLFGDFVIAGKGGLLEDGVITFPKGNVACAFEADLRDYSIEDFYGAFGGNQSGLFRVIFPGSEVADYSLAGTYKGMDVAADNTTVTAKFGFTYGYNVSAIKYLVIEGDVENRPEEAKRRLFAGTDENIQTIEGLVGENENIDIKLSLTRGVYSVVAAAVKTDGTLYERTAIVVPFYFPSIGEQEDTSCQFELNLGLVSQLASDVMTSEELALHPDYVSLAYSLQGKDLKSIAYFVSTSEQVEKALTEMTAEELVAASGITFDIDTVEGASTGEWIGTFDGLNPETGYTMIVIAKNIYGSSITVTKSATTTIAPPYEGKVVIGNYIMECANKDENDKDVVSTNKFQLRNVPGSNTSFYVKGFVTDDSNEWKAEYNETNNTLVLNGQIRYLETKGDEGNMFGYGLGYYNTEMTQLYAVVAYPDYENNKNGANADVGPAILTLDPETNQLNGLDSKLMLIHVLADLTTNIPSNIKMFSGSRTTIKLDTGNEENPEGGNTEDNGNTEVENPEDNGSVAPAARRQSSVVSVPFSSIRISKELLSNKAESLVYSKGGRLVTNSQLRTIKPVLVEYSRATSTKFVLGSDNNIKVRVR